ncbi:MAG: TonB-dependent receptor [Pseudomonadota bacterium]
MVSNTVNDDIAALRSKAFRRRFLISSALISSAFGADIGQAHAQLEEIMVTARQRTESLQDVPISVSAVSGDFIVRNGVQRLEDLSTTVPNLVVREGFAGETIAIRGFGSNQNPSFEQAVSTFIDGVYFGRAKQSLAAFLDVERLEVLRGPQSTIFGNNAIAGALNLTTTRPGQEMEGYAFASYNPDDDEVDLTGALTVPITDTLSTRVAFKYLNLGGYFNSFFGDDVPARENAVGRVSVLWEPADNLEIFVKGEIGRQDAVGAASQLIDCPVGGGAFSAAPSPGRENVGSGACDLAQRLNPDITFALDNQIETGGLNPQTVIPIAPSQINDTLGQVGGEFRDLDTSNINLTINYGFENGITLTSVSGYSSYASDRRLDVDTTPFAFISTDRQEDYEQFSQELRLTSPGGETFDWLVGAYYQQSDVAFGYQTFTLLDSPDGPNPGGPPGGNGNAGFLLGVFAGDLTEDNDQWAIFGSATYNFTEKLRATVGLRYSEVDKFGDYQIRLGVTPNNEAVPVQSAGAAVPFFGSPAAPAFVAHTVSDSVASNELTYQANLQYDVSDTVMVYGSISNGFKAGGFDNLIRLPAVYPAGVGLVPTLEGTSTGGSFTFEQETVDAYEIGVKIDLANVRVNIAAFYNEFDNLQQSIFNPTAIAFQIRNAAAAKSKGVEIDGQWAATENLVFNFAGTLLDAEYTDFPQGSCDQLSTNAGLRFCDLSGAELPYTPDWSATIGANHTQPLGAGSLAVFTNVQLVLSGGYRSGVELDPRFEVGSYQILDARIAIGDQEAGWRVGIWGRNLTDELFQTASLYGAVRSVGAYTTATNRPMSWGFFANMEF